MPYSTAMAISNNTRISVITVNLNDEKGLARTGKSISDRSDIEWIVVDGHSKDGSKVIAESFLGKMQGDFLERKPSGIYDAMNFGATKAKGEWLWFLNAGDFLISRENFSLLSPVLKESTVVAVVSPVLNLTNKGYLYSITHPILGESQLETNHQGVLVRRSVFEKIGGFDTSLKLAADGKFLDEVVRNFPVREFALPITAFELGGRSAQSYSLTIKEIETFRVKVETAYPNLYKTKNSVRLFLLRSDSDAFTFYFKSRYLKIREARQIRCSPWSSVDKKFMESLRDKYYDKF